MTLRQRFASHMRTQHGSIYVHAIFDDETGLDVGTRTEFLPKHQHRPKHPPYRKYMLGEREFGSPAELVRAYEEEKEKCSAIEDVASPSNVTVATK